MAVPPFDAVIALAGQPGPDDLFASLLLSRARRIISADGGADRAARLGFVSDYIVGDFDSIADGDARATAASAKHFRFPRDKDHTDGELALAAAVLLSSGKHVPDDEYELYRQFDAIGDLRGMSLLFLNYFGSRHDHTLANMALALLASRRRADVFLTDGTTLGRLVTGPACLRPVFPSDCFVRAGERAFLFSVLPLDDRVDGLTLRGLRWELDNARLPLTRALALSNRAPAGYPDCASLALERGTVALFTFPEDL